jgi:ribosomal protein L37AE/L43A
MNSRRPWTSLELRRLREDRHLGLAALAELLGRTPASVERAAHRYGISLRRPAEARGIIADQRRPLAPGVHAAWVADPEAALERVAAYREAALCPDCGRRRIQVHSSGLCELCHVEMLGRTFSPEREAVQRAGALLDALLEVFTGDELELQRRAIQARKRRQRRREETAS